MSYKSEKYGAKDDFDEMEGLTEKLAQDLRRHIRQLSAVPVLSESWLNTADTFGRLANISDMESKLSESKSSGTLWETEEQALRFLLEDGKLNLCLRSMVDYKQQQRQALKGHDSRSPILDRAEVCDKYEKGLGTVLRNAWNHIEVLQTTDLRLLLQHITDVIDTALECESFFVDLGRKGDLHQRQEIMVFYYLSAILHNVESVGEQRVMPIIRTEKLLIKFARFLLMVHSYIAVSHKLKIIEVLSQISDSEDCKSYKDEYVSNAQDARIILDVKNTVVTAVCTNMELKKISRNFTDLVDRSKRIFKV